MSQAPDEPEGEVTESQMAPYPGRPTTPAAAIGWSIFASRWLQAPLYIGLIVAQLIYVIKFWNKLIDTAVDFPNMGENAIMLAVLGLVDVVMIANLLIMVIIGGYETFVSRIKVDNHPDQPEWLSHVNANVLKVKLAMAIIGISSIHLLKTFIEYGSKDTGLTETEVMWQTIIHVVFVLSAIGLAFIDKYLSPAPGRHDPGP
jgi:uncharacterized protein (TIGR00645 family)